MKKIIAALAALLLLTTVACTAGNRTTGASSSDDAPESLSRQTDETPGPETPFSSPAFSDPSRSGSASLPSDASTSSEPAPEDLPAYAGVVFENRKSYVQGMPVKSDRLLGGTLRSAEAQEEAPVTLTLCGEEFVFRIQGLTLLQNEAGDVLETVKNYSTGGRFSIGFHSGASFDEQGRLISARFWHSFLPETFGEEEIRSLGKEIAEELAPFALSGLSLSLQTLYRENGDTIAADGFLLKEDEATLTYRISYDLPVGGLPSGRYLRVNVCPYSVPLPSLDIEIGYEEPEAFVSRYPENFDVDALLASVTYGCGDLPAPGVGIVSVDYRRDTLYFSVTNGMPGVNVAVVVTTDDGMQYETEWRFVFTE